MRVHLCAVGLVLAIALVVPGFPAGTLGVGAAAADTEPGCEQVFAVAEAILGAVEMTRIDGHATPATLAPALQDLTIAGCADAEEWLAVAPGHPTVLGGLEAPDVLTARCADLSATVASSPACDASLAPSPGATPQPRLVALPAVIPRVKGAGRTRTYPIRGLSPDELFTQMQLNGSGACPTHAVACTNIQPILRPLVSSGAGCRVIRIEASLGIEAVVPRWAGPERVYPELVAWWRKVAARVGRHESEHIRIAERHLARLRREIVGRPCGSLSVYVTRWSQGLTAAQDAFDRQEADRPWPAYAEPVPAGN